MVCISYCSDCKKYLVNLEESVYRDECRPICKKLNILTLSSLYVYEVVAFVKQNYEYCE